MLKNITNYNFYENEDKNELEKLADFYTAHIDSYNINNPVILYLGRNGHLFRITAYSKGDEQNALKCFRKCWWCKIEKYSLALDWLNFGIKISFSHQFPLDAIEIFMWYMSIEEEEVYA